MRVARVLKHLDYLNELLLVFLPGNNHLKNTNCSTALSFPELRISIEPLKYIKGLDREVELAHLVAVVGDQVE